MIRRLTIFAALALSLLALQPVTATGALAQNCDQNCIRRLVANGEVMPLSQLIVTSGVAQRGEILDAQLFERNGKWFYAFRMLNKSDNNVFGIFVDAKTGTIVSRP